MIKRLESAEGESLAYVKIEGSESRPTLVFCGGFRSDMEGSKALAVCDYAETKGLGAIRFDYFAHGASSGNFADGSIGKWLESTLRIIDEVSTGPLVLIGSSMGGWIAALAAEARPERVTGLQLMAAAPDFTRRLMWAKMDQPTRDLLTSQGLVEQPNDYSDEPYRIYHHLIEEGDAHLMLERDIKINCPVRLMHGLKDTDVPWTLAQEMMEKIQSDDVEMELVKNGDHRLSSDEDLDRLRGSISKLVGKTA